VRGSKTKSPLGKDDHKMKHNLKICVSKKPQEGGIVSCRNVSLRERVLTRLLGQKQRLMILVPGDSVDTVAITEVPEGGVPCE